MGVSFVPGRVQYLLIVRLLIILVDSICHFSMYNSRGCEEHCTLLNLFEMASY